MDSVPHPPHTHSPAADPFPIDPHLPPPPTHTPSFKTKPDGNVTAVALKDIPADTALIRVCKRVWMEGWVGLWGYVKGVGVYGWVN